MYVYSYIYIYIHIYTYMYIHIYIYTCIPRTANFLVQSTTARGALSRPWCYVVNFCQIISCCHIASASPGGGDCWIAGWCAPVRLLVFSLSQARRAAPR